MKPEELQAHLDKTVEIANYVKSKLPPMKKYFGDTLRLKCVRIESNENSADFIAEYTAYRGCGEWDSETMFVNLNDLEKSDD